MGTESRGCFGWDILWPGGQDTIQGNPFLCRDCPGLRGESLLEGLSLRLSCRRKSSPGRRPAPCHSLLTPDGSVGIISHLAFFPAWPICPSPLLSAFFPPPLLLSTLRPAPASPLPATQCWLALASNLSVAVGQPIHVLASHSCHPLESVERTGFNGTVCVDRLRGWLESCVA